MEEGVGLSRLVGPRRVVALGTTRPGVLEGPGGLEDWPTIKGPEGCVGVGSHGLVQAQ